ncbi:MAG: ABC transporter permease [Vicinamibacteraceae bacterium]
MSRSERFFRRLLRLFPAEFRSDFGNDMTQTFKDHRDDVVVRGGAMAHVRLWKDTVLGVLTTAPHEHWDLLRQDIRYGLRSLRRSPGFAVVATTALAVGISANTAIFSIVNGVLLQPLPYRDPDRLVTLFEQVPDMTFGFSAPDFTIVRGATRSFDGLVAYRNVSYELSGLARSERVVAARVLPELFAVLGVMPAIGRPFTAADDATDAKVAVLSDALWRRAFAGDPGIIGRTIALDRQPYIVVGVMPEKFVFPPRGSDRNGEPAAIYVPMAFTPLERGAFGSMYNNSTVARLRPGVTREQARADLAAAARVVAPQYPAAMRTFADRLTFTIGPLAEEAVGRSRRLLLILMGAVGMVLLICCADVANLMLTRSGGRQRELAVRSALGASQVRVVRQLLTESLVLAVTGAAVGLCLAFVIMQAFLPMLGDTLPRSEDIQVNGRVVLFTVLLALATPLVFGVMPALRSAVMSTAAALTEGARTTTPGRGRHWLLGALVVAQCALALVLSVGAGLLVRSFVRLTQTETGFQAEHVVNATMGLPSGRYATGAQVKSFYREAVAATAALPGVTSAGAATHRPLQVRERRGFTPDPSAQQTPGLGRSLKHTMTVGRYFETLGIPLREGRFFTDADGQRDGERVIIVSEMLARRFWPNGDAVGRRLRWNSASSTPPWMTIVGVVGDIKQGALDAETTLQTYEPLMQAVADDLGHPIIGAYSDVNLIVRSERPSAAIIGELSAAMRRLDPELAISNVQPVLEIIDDSVKSQRFSTTVLAIFATVAVSLAALGIYGALANVVAQQTKELGVRLALGAAPWSVLWLVLRRAFALTATGIALGLAGAMALTRLMSGLLYEVQPHDAVTFVGASVGLAVLVLLASLVPAVRATQVDPIIALRME